MAAAIMFYVVVNPVPSQLHKLNTQVFETRGSIVILLRTQDIILWFSPPMFYLNPMKQNGLPEDTK